MSSFIASNSMYNIQTDNEVTIALAHFSPELIFDSFIQQIRDRESFINISSPNVPAAFEQQFKQLMTIYPNSIQQIEQTRVETYKSIISILCTECGLRFNDNIEDIDYFSVSFYLYQLLVSDYYSLLTNFFVNFILKEKNGIYSMLNLSEEKRNKDSSTLYYKKVFKNPKLIVISANLDSVINSIGIFNLSFHDILSNIYGNLPIAQCIESCCMPTEDFFVKNYLPVLNSSIRPIIITNIRIMLQQLATNDNSNINFI